jgi:hypothetical protein
MSLALFFQQGCHCVFDIPVLKRLRLGEPTAEDKLQDQPFEPAHQQTSASCSINC